MARTARTARKKSKAVEIDFEGVDSGGGGFHIKEGSYLMKCTGCEDTESDAGNAMFKWEFTGQEKAAKGKKFYIYTVYDPPTSLWKLRSLLEALGQEVPDGPMEVDPDEMIDLELIGHVTDEEYDGKTNSKMTDFSSVDGDEEEEEEEEEKPVRGRKKKPAAKDEEDEEEEEEKPKRGAAKKKARGKKELEALSADEVKAFDEDEMAEVVEKYELEVDLDEHKTPRRKASAIIAALEEKELLSDE
jgi:hypothetical protein